MDETFEEWRKVAFSYGQIEEFLQIISMSQSEAMTFFLDKPELLRCFGTGFYYFVEGIRGELNPEFGNALHSLACRVEQNCNDLTLGSWPQNSDEAGKILGRFFQTA